MDKLEIKFWKRVNKSTLTGCWEWEGSLNKAKYGCFYIKTETKWVMKFAHRFSWSLTNGPIPQGLYICHKCDNPKCVNPDHLWAGTQAENVQDMFKKGRANRPKGEAHRRARLTKKIVVEIRKSRESNRSLAKKYNIDKHAIKLIREYKAWKHIPPSPEDYIPSAKPNKVLAKQTVEAIYASSGTFESTAKQYNVAIVTVWRIKHKVRYKKVTDNLDV